MKDRQHLAAIAILADAGRSLDGAWTLVVHGETSKRRANAMPGVGPKAAEGCALVSYRHLGTLAKRPDATSRPAMQGLSVVKKLLRVQSY